MLQWASNNFDEATKCFYNISTMEEDNSVFRTELGAIITKQNI